MSTGQQDFALAEMPLPVVGQDPIELSVILPAYNEGCGVRTAVEMYLAELPKSCKGFEIIVIDDGSTDDTASICSELTAKYSDVKVVRHQTNRGQGLALLSGFKEARGRVVMHNGIDLPFDPAWTATVIERIRNGADVVVVERTNRGAYGPVRTILSWCNVALSKGLLRSPFGDCNFVQGYRRSVLLELPVVTNGVSTVTTEVILKARDAGFRVERMRCDYNARVSGKSSISVRRVFHTTIELLRLPRVMRHWRRLQRQRCGDKRATL